MPRIFPNRLYASGVGTKWAFLRWSDAQSPYLDRLFLIKTPWGAVSLNWINQPDSGDPHDHTSAFLSILLKGWYVEYRETTPGKTTLRELRWVRFFNYMRGCDWDAHRILDVSPGGALTLCLMGPKVRDWCYHTPEGPILWSDYEAWLKEFNAI